MVSRQTLTNRRRSVTELQARAGAGMTVAYDEARGFVVRRAGHILIAARYEVVWAWLDGYRSGLNGAFPFEENPALYDVARDACHAAGLPWTDPRTGITYDPPKAP